MKRNVHSSSKERGFIALMYAAMITVIIGFAGLAVDVGYLEYQKRRIQAAADAAALSALREIEHGTTTASVLTTVGRDASAMNGFANDGTTIKVTINNPPKSGNFTTNSKAVEAVVQETFPTFFMRIFHQDSSTLTGRAVGLTSTTYGSVGGCIFAMDPTANGALTVDGTANITTACGMVVNSSSSSAFTQVGTSAI